MTDSPDAWKRVEALLREDQRIQNEIDAIWKRLGQYPEPQGVWFGGHPNAFHNWTSTTTTTTTTTTSPGCPCTIDGTQEFTISGISGTALCVDFNRDYDLTPAPSGACGWVEDFTTANGSFHITLAFASGLGEWQLTLTGGFAAIQYSLAAGLWDCDGPNEMSLDVSVCDGWPSTITVTKV